MKRKQIVIFISLVFLLVIFGLALLVGYNQNYTVKYFESFKFMTNKDQTKEIIFKKELAPQEAKGKWHLKAYFNLSGEVAKFESFDKDGNSLETIDDTQAYKVREE